MAKQDPSSQDKSHMPPWFVDDLGAKGFHFETIEDYDVPPEESFGSLFMPDHLEKGYHVEEIKDGVYWLTSGWYDCMFLTTGNGVIAVDAPTALGEKSSTRSRTSPMNP